MCAIKTYGLFICQFEQQFEINFSFSIYGCFAYMYVYALYAYLVQSVRRGIRSPGLGILDGWELNQGPLKEQLVH